MVGRFQGREPVLDAALEARIAAILRGLADRWPEPRPGGPAPGRASRRVVPRGAEVLEPVGTAPGLVVAARGRRRPDGRGPARARRASCGRCGRRREASAGLRAAIAGATTYREAELRMFGIPESEIAETLRRAEAPGVDLGALEITTCLRRGEVEVVTRYEPAAQAAYDALRRRGARAPRRDAVQRRRVRRSSRSSRAA